MSIAAAMDFQKKRKAELGENCGDGGALSGDLVGNDETDADGSTKPPSPRPPSDHRDALSPPLSIDGNGDEHVMIVY